jgi:hypothetical protein
MPSRRPAHNQHPLQLAESKRFHQQEYLEFPQCANIGTGPKNAHLATS